MGTFIFLLMWQVEWIQAQDTPQPIYQKPVSAVDMQATEPPIVHSVPYILTRWDIAKPGAKYMTHLYAGKAEFPFVVRISGNTWCPCLPPDEIVVRELSGLLITNTVILTACRAVSIVFCKKKDKADKELFPKDPQRVPDFEHHVDIFPGAEHTSEQLLACKEEDLGLTVIRFDRFYVDFATVFLNEDNKLTDEFGYYTEDYEERYRGTRSIARILLHPDCKPWETLENDVGLVQMFDPITPSGTWVGLASIPVDDKGNIIRKALDSQTLCHVAGFNNDYNGLSDDDQLTKHYKVKFRVYQKTISYCKSYTRLICMGRPPHVLMGCVKWLERIESLNIKKEDHGIECWETRNKVGAVCDLHTGAPLVCDGDDVHGFVLRAAEQKRCNNMWPLPFFVARMYKFDQYFSSQILVLSTPLEGPIHIPGLKPRDYPFPRRSSSIPRSSNELLLQICVLNVLLLIQFQEL